MCYNNDVMRQFKKTTSQGFTLIETMLTVTLIGMMATTALVAINPQRQIMNARNTARQSDIATILSTINQYIIESAGTRPAGITGVETYICKTTASDCTGLVNLHELTDYNLYLSLIPVDPLATSSSNSAGYTIFADPFNNNAITLRAPLAERGEVIKITQ